MTLVQLGLLGAAALLCGYLGRWRTWGLLICSLLAIFWLQTISPVRFIDFWSAAASIGFTIWVWFTIQPQGTDETGGAREVWKKTLPGILITGGIVLVLGATRYLRVGYGEPPFNLLASRPPDMLQIILAGAVLVALAAGMASWIGIRRAGLATAGVTLLAIFIILKTEPAAAAASALLRQINGQQTSLASALDLRWVGYSYLAFRLLHVIQDHRAKRLPVLTFPE